MTRFTLAALTGAVLLCGCAGTSNTAPQGQQTVAERGTTSIGSLIPRKGNSRADNVSNVDKQALENDRIMNNGTNNGY